MLLGWLSGAGFVTPSASASQTGSYTILPQTRTKQEAKENKDYPTQIIINSTASKIRDLIIARAAMRGSNIEEVSDYKVVLSRTVEGFQGILTQALIGNAYSDEPKYLVTLVIVQLDQEKVL